jgi:hypothetical protein
MFVLWAFCSALALLVARPWLTLEFAGWTTHQLIPTAFGLMATTLWCGAMGLAVLTGRIVYNRIKSDR